MITNIKTKRLTKKRQKIGNNILKILQEKDMIAQELADKLKMDQSHLSRIITGNRKYISLIVAWDISSVLGKTIEEVFIREKTK